MLRFVLCAQSVRYTGRVPQRDVCKLPSVTAHSNSHWTIVLPNSGFTPYVCLSTLSFRSPHGNLWTYAFTDMLHSPLGFPRRISRLVVGYYLEEHEPNLLLKRQRLCSLMGALAVYQFAFTSGIGIDNNLVTLVEYLSNHFQLFQHAGVCLASPRLSPDGD